MLRTLVALQALLICASMCSYGVLVEAQAPSPGRASISIAASTVHQALKSSPYSQWSAIALLRMYCTLTSFKQRLQVNFACVLAGAAPSCSSLGLPATAEINGASYSKCQNFGGANWCQSSKAPGWDVCPVINGQAFPAPDPVLSATAAKGVSSPEPQCPHECKPLSYV